MPDSGCIAGSAVNLDCRSILHVVFWYNKVATGSERSIGYHGTSAPFRRFDQQLHFSSAFPFREGVARMIYDLVGIITLLLVIWALIGILQSGASPVEKLIWVIIILVIPLVGFLLWYLMGPGSKAFPLRR
jgi:hypothetical protein